MTEARTEATTREIRIFGLLWLVFFAAVAALGGWRPQGLLGAAAFVGSAWLVGWLFGGVDRVRTLAGVLLPGMFALAGAAPRWGIERKVAFSLLALGAAGALLLWIAPRAGRAVYDAWMQGAAPIGWTITRVVLAIVFYLAITPIGLLMRLFGKDPMHRRFEPEATTYWTERRETPDAKRYFRQF